MLLEPPYNSLWIKKQPYQKKIAIFKTHNYNLTPSQSSFEGNFHPQNELIYFI